MDLAVVGLHDLVVAEKTDHRRRRRAGEDRAEPRHLDGGQRSCFALVPIRTAGAGEGLFHVIGGEHTECHWNPRVADHLAHAIGDRSTDVVEVGSAAANHRSQRDQGIIAFGDREDPRSLWDLEGAGHPGDVNVRLAAAAALELGRDGIRVNTVCPAGGNPEMFGPFLPRMQPFFDETIAYTQQRAMPGEVPLEQIADAVAWLASDASRRCTGVDLPVDGGSTSGTWIAGFNTL